MAVVRFTAAAWWEGAIPRRKSSKMDKETKLRRLTQEAFQKRPMWKDEQREKQSLEWAPWAGQARASAEVGPVSGGPRGPSRGSCVSHRVVMNFTC